MIGSFLLLHKESSSRDGVSPTRLRGKKGCMGKNNKSNKRKIDIMTQKEIDMKKLLTSERLDKLTKKGGNARIVAKLKRQLRALESTVAAE